MSKTMDPKDLIATLQMMSKKELEQVRKILGIGDAYSRKEIDTATGKEKEKGK